MSETYQNPVYPHSFPDPFVLKYCGEYWAYCSGPWHDGRCFGVLHSRDLVRWRALAGAMEPLPDRPTHYWAPEVTYDNGRFLMYYSVGDEEHMHIRVAVAERPAGPFVDSGRRLTSETFAIDAHVFVDDDGARYLFYATDFLDRRHVGTGTVRDLLRDALTTAGQPRPVTLPRYDWQVYDPQRAEKGGVRWHTVEGPFVLKRKGRYYQMFSGGNWQNTSYGVSYAIGDSIATPDEWSQAANGERVLPILRTLPGQIIGPGHNSVVRGPDNRQLFCVYHRWSADLDERQMAIDPLEWAGERMLVLGPSDAPQPAPFAPAVAAFFPIREGREETRISDVPFAPIHEVHEDHEGENRRIETPSSCPSWITETEYSAGPLGPDWECVGGRWSIRAGPALQEATDGLAEARCLIGAPCFVAEVSLRALDDPSIGDYGVGLYDAVGALLRCMIEPGRGHLALAWRGEGWSEQRIALPPVFEPRAYHLLRLEVDGPRVSVALDDVAVRWQRRLGEEPTNVGLLAHGMAAAFTGFALTIGWEDLFAQPDAEPSALGWRAEGDAGGWELREQQLWQTSARPDAVIAKGPPLESYLLVVNVRLDATSAPGGRYGFYPAMPSAGRGPLLAVERDGDGWALVCSGTAGAQRFPLPAGFDPFVYQQFRFRKQAGRLAVAWESHSLGLLEVSPQATQVGLYADRAVVAFDLVRVTVMETMNDER